MDLCYNINKRLSDTKQLWIVGCSVTLGIGVKLEERYGNIISKELNLPATTLAGPGTSIEWAANQILTSDIKKDDIVIWGLTGALRYPFAADDKLLNVTPSLYHAEVKPYISEKYFLSQDIIYRAKRSILQVNNFTDKIGAHLLMGFLPLNGPDTDFLMYNYVKDMKSTVLLYDLHSDQIHLDKGSDNQHPGPITHRYYADLLVKTISEMKF